MRTSTRSGADRAPATSAGRARATTNDEPPYARYAFLNPYNLSFFAGGVALAVASGHSWIAVLTCAAEAMWLIFAPDSKLLRRVWFDPALARVERLAREDRRADTLRELAPEDCARVARLFEQEKLIEALARDNPSLGVDLLAGELAKLDDLLDEFIELARTASRSERYSASIDVPSLRRTWQHHEAVAQRHARGDPRRTIAEKNLDVLRRRSARYEDLTRHIQVARGQMDLIEQTFRLLADEILTMASPRELGGRIEELRVAVEAVREAAMPAEDDLWMEEERNEEHR